MATRARSAIEEKGRQDCWFAAGAGQDAAPAREAVNAAPQLHSTAGRGPADRRPPSARTMPTPEPGWNSVPRCRMMMLPGMQRCPPNSLTPRYLGLESLVFCVDPPCFLDAKRSCCHCVAAAAAGSAKLVLQHSVAAAAAGTAPAADQGWPEGHVRHQACDSEQQRREQVAFGRCSPVPPCRASCRPSLQPRRASAAARRCMSKGRGDRGGVQAGSHETGAALHWSL